MKLAVKIMCGVVTLLILIRGIILSIDYLYKKYGRRYIETNN